jgi:hypothetical protein
VIEKDELSPLIEKESANNWLNIVMGLFLAVATFLSINCFIDIIHILNDDTIPMVVCPKSFEIDSPVLMKTINLSSAEAKDKWIKGFMRRFVQAQFPRNPSEAEASLKYVVEHSQKDIHARYGGYLNKLEDFQNLLTQGYYYSFYPNNSLDIRIRASGAKGEWAVEIDGFMIRTAINKEDRTTPTLRYVVRAGDHTMQNPEGLYVVDGNLLEIADYVSGRKDEK